MEFKLSNSGILFSVKAADKVAGLIADEGNPLLNLRVAISGGGCSGFLYNFTLDDIKNSDDTSITQTSSEGSEIKLLVDSVSWQYLNGSEIDYKEDINGGALVVNNPNATTTCGCGSSFSLKDDE